MGTFAGADGPIYFDSGNRRPITIESAQIDGTDLRVLVPETVVIGGQTLSVPRQPSISADGRTVAFHMSRAGAGAVLMQCAVETGAVSFLDFGRATPIEGAAVSLSPDGEQVAFVNMSGAIPPPIDPIRGGVGPSSWLWIADKNGVRIGLDLPPLGWFVGVPQWSPDGRWIAVAVMPQSPGGTSQIQLVDPNDPTNTRVVAEQTQYFDGDVSWHPSSSALALHGEDSITVVYVDSDGQAVGTNQVGGPEDRQPVFAPSSAGAGQDALLVRRIEPDPLMPLFWLLRDGEPPKRVGAGLHGDFATWGVPLRPRRRIQNDVLEGLRPRRPQDETPLQRWRRLWRRLFP